MMALAWAGIAFGLDDFTGPPRLANWICQTDNFDPVAGPPVALSRDDLRWQLTVPDDGSLPYGGAYPTLIKWAQGVRHPAEGLVDSGCRLAAFEVTHSEASALAEMTGLADPRVTFAQGPLRLRAAFDTPLGPRELS
jgi:hypothetical protein